MQPFSVTDDKTTKAAINALNTSFDSIKNMVETYTPKTTKQDFGIAEYYGPIKEGSKIYMDRACEGSIPIYCQYGAQNYFCGEMQGNEITFNVSLGEPMTEDDAWPSFMIYQPYRAAIVNESTDLSHAPKSFQLDSMPAETKR